MIVFNLLNKVLKVDVAASLKEAVQAYEEEGHPAERPWQVVELNSADYAAVTHDFAPLDAVDPLWITYAESEVEAEALAELMRCHGRRALARMTPRRRPVRPDPSALLHVKADPSATLSSGKTLQEHLDSLAF